MSGNATCIWRWFAPSQSSSMSSSIMLLPSPTSSLLSPVALLPLLPSSQVSWIPDESHKRSHKESHIDNRSKGSKNHPCIISNPKRIELLEQRLELQRSIGRSEGIRKSSALEKDLAEMDKLSPLLFQVIAMYKENETTKRRSTKYSINSILLTVFGITPPNSGKISSISEWLLLLQQQDKGQGQSWEDGQPSCCYSEQCKYTLAVSTMPTSKGEYDDRCFVIGNIFSVVL